MRAWVQVVRAAEWRNPPAIKRMFNSAGILRDGRVVFDIAGNRYRLVAWVNFDLPADILVQAYKLNQAA